MSCIPIGYVIMLIDTLGQKGDGETGGSSLKLTKILRLVRLGKNLARIARLKKLKQVRGPARPPTLSEAAFPMRLPCVRVWLYP